MATAQEAKNMRNKIDIEGTIERCSESRTINLKVGGTSEVMDAYLVDNTGEIKVSLWGADIKKVKNGSVVEIKNGYSNTFKGETSLGVGKFGTLTVKKY